MAKKDTGIFQFEKMDATFRCYQLRSVSGVLQAPSIEMEAEYTVLQVQPRVNSDVRSAAMTASFGR